MDTAIRLVARSVEEGVNHRCTIPDKNLRELRAIMGQMNLHGIILIPIRSINLLILVRTIGDVVLQLLIGLLVLVEHIAITVVIHKLVDGMDTHSLFLFFLQKY
jgi:hypothetical protein